MYNANMSGDSRANQVSLKDRFTGVRGRSLRKFGSELSMLTAELSVGVVAFNAFVGHDGIPFPPNSLGGWVAKACEVTVGTRSFEASYSQMSKVESAENIYRRVRDEQQAHHERSIHPTDQ